jgi:hypothetical protein
MPVLDDHFAIADGHEQDTLLAIERFANALRNKVQYLSRPPSPETLKIRLTIATNDGEARQ